MVMFVWNLLHCFEQKKKTYFKIGTRRNGILTSGLLRDVSLLYLEQLAWWEITTFMRKENQGLSTDLLGCFNRSRTLTLSLTVISLTLSPLWFLYSIRAAAIHGTYLENERPIIEAKLRDKEENPKSEFKLVHGGPKSTESSPVMCSVGSECRRLVI